MAERPILFSGAMVRALLDGRKTVTRRLVDPLMFIETTNPDRIVEQSSQDFGRAATEWARSPYGQPGDRLWVKETWRPEVVHSHAMDACDCGDVAVTYRADGARASFPDGSTPNEWTLPKAAKRGNVTPLFMPRWASRLTLEVVSVRVERLHDITEEDARAEGVKPLGDTGWWCTGVDTEPLPTARVAFQYLWHAINGAESWDANPWVWRVEFRRMEAAR